MIHVFVLLQLFVSLGFHLTLTSTADKKKLYNLLEMLLIWLVCKISVENDSRQNKWDSEKAEHKQNIDTDKLKELQTVTLQLFSSRGWTVGRVSK